MSVWLPSVLAAAGMLVGPAESAPVQRPVVQSPTTTPAAEVAPESESPTAPADTPAEVTPETTPAEPEPTPAEVAPEPTPEPELTPTSDGDEGVFRVASERAGPPYYTEGDLAELRERHGVDPVSPAAPTPVRWRCLIADPTCRHSFELQALGGYAMRARQGDVSMGTVDRWNSARAQYDLWASLPALVESVGKTRYTRMSLGPKGGVIFSDTGDMWGNLGIAARYWLGRGHWAPSIEITSALSFKLATRLPQLDGDPDAFRMQRGPVGFQADVGFGLGGFGSIVFGGQYDSPLAREEIPEEYRVVSSGMFYVGFRGNILWGGPAVAAVAAHASTRAVNRP